MPCAKERSWEDQEIRVVCQALNTGPQRHPTCCEHKLQKDVFSDHRRCEELEAHRTIHGGSTTGSSSVCSADCKRTGKSTIARLMMLGNEYIQSLSLTPRMIGTSSGDAELTSLLKCSCEASGLLQLEQDWQIKVEGETLVFFSAALWVVGRQGASKLMQVEAAMEASIL